MFSFVQTIERILNRMQYEATTFPPMMELMGRWRQGQVHRNASTTVTIAKHRNSHRSTDCSVTNEIIQ